MGTRCEGHNNLLAYQSSVNQAVAQNPLHLCKSIKKMLNLLIFQRLFDGVCSNENKRYNFQLYFNFSGIKNTHNDNGHLFVSVASANCKCSDESGHMDGLARSYSAHTQSIDADEGSDKV